MRLWAIGNLAVFAGLMYCNDSVPLLEFISLDFGFQIGRHYCEMNELGISIYSFLAHTLQVLEYVLTFASLF
jgi:hypothetical protein